MAPLTFTACNTWYRGWAQPHVTSILELALPKSCSSLELPALALKVLSSNSTNYWTNSIYLTFSLSSSSRPLLPLNLEKLLQRSSKELSSIAS